ncbi:hypothetical protein IGJ19_000972 [Enterococcus sp. DIV1368b]|nr:hypothetical protein SAMN04487758_1062 [Enterococcus mundtii]
MLCYNNEVVKKQGGKNLNIPTKKLLTNNKQDGILMKSLRNNDKQLSKLRKKNLLTTS